MSFVSVEYFAFLFIVASVFFYLPHRYRWVWLLGASYYFYSAWNASYLILIVASTVIDYSIGYLLGKVDDKGYRRILLTISVITNLGILFVFKYFNFFTDSVQVVLLQLNLDYMIPNLNVLLPVGISFYTFQSMSYTIDVYRGIIPVERHFGRFAAFISFFPQLVAGPIERAKNFLPQFQTVIRFDYQRVRSGLFLITWGVFKKAVVADGLATIVNTVYGSPEHFTGIQLIIATVAFSFQIYCDFSGYSDIAIGSARILGFDLMQNFAQPYFSKNIAEFWRRWHISLSTWFRDYLYIPLGGNRVSASRWRINLLIVFVVSGIWHGANWTFFIWGLLHGLYLVVTTLWTNSGEKNSEKPFQIPAFIQVVITYTVVTYAWIFFRADTVADAIYISRNLFTGFDIVISELLSTGYTYYVIILQEIGLVNRYNIFILLFSVFALLAGDYLNTYHKDLLDKWDNVPFILRWFTYYAILIFILVFGAYGESQFIYFQF